MEAACVRPETAVALTRVAAPVAPRNVRREMLMMLAPLVSGRLGSRHGGFAARTSAGATAAQN